MNRAVLQLTLYKLAAAVLGIAYSVLQVRIFGATAEVDAFFVATSAVYMITSLVQGGQLAEVFLPEYLKVKAAHSPAQAHRLFSAVVNRLMAAVAGLSLLALAFAPFLVGILGPGLAPESRELASGMFQLSLVLIVFTLFSSFVNTTLNAEGIFGRAELTGLVNNAISLFLIFSFHQQAGIWILVYALLAGKAVELVSGIWFLRKAGLRYHLVWSVPGYEILRFFRVLFVTSGYVGATQLYTSVVTASASFLPPGTLSVYNYVKFLCTKASGILIAPVTTVFFSGFSNLAAKAGADLSRKLMKPLAGILFVTLLMTAYIFLGGKELLTLLWKSASMDEVKLQLAYEMLVLGFVGLILSGLGGIFRKSAVALGASSALYTAWIFTQLASALYSYLSIRFWGTTALLFILPVNMGLMALVSFRVAGKQGIHWKEAFRNVKGSSRLLGISLLLLPALWFIQSGLFPAHWDFRLLALAKIGGFSILLVALFGLFFFKEIRSHGFQFREYLK